MADEISEGHAGGGHQEAGELTAWDRVLLDRTQQGIPLESRPFAAIARELGVPGGEEGVIERLSGLQAAGLLRRVGAVMDSRALGYTGTLCGAVVKPEAIQVVAAHVGSYPGVTHCYERENRFNLWFTLLAPDRALIEQIVSAVSGQAGVHELVELPIERRYKINVAFRLGPAGPSRSPAPEAARASARPEARERAIIRVIQNELPLVTRPFAALAAECARAGAALEEDELLVELARYRRLGYLRRISTVLAHRRVGITANGMVVWRIPDEDCDRAGTSAAQFEAVTHCYRRRTADRWPYNLYAMVHAGTREECLAHVAEINARVGAYPYRVLFSTREFKKSSMRYFCEERSDAELG